MITFKKIIHFIVNSNYRFVILANFGFFKHMDDKEYLTKLYKFYIGKVLNLESPQTFNEKLQWLKLYYRRPELTKMVDKVEARDIIKSKLGEKYLIPLLGIWDKSSEIDFATLPDSFVLKCNHNSGLGMCICRNKNNISFSQVKKDLEKGLKQDYYLTSREWPYKNVRRKILAEKFMGDNLVDYKFMCFNGKVEFCFTCTDRFNGGLKVTFFDRNWNRLPFKRHYESSKDTISKPFNFDKMIKFAEILSDGMPFLRVDFYEVDKKIFVGELTLFPGSGFEEFSPEEFDYKIGKLLTLPKPYVSY